MSVAVSQHTNFVGGEWVDSAGAGTMCGFKESGFGKDLPVYSLEDYTRIEHFMAKID